ncbi:alpha/beta fold hydrolase [Streptomyces sp. P9-2B-2]|uniref:thioesterase domain-containing protein n=1 Tax=Streptomyces TaxID=1883 RepID=UPI0022506AF4|nr:MULTISPECIES: thioesterase domain-containing protein [Streptomyces]MCX4635104.1 alpha/beta fold hydrolase [Streptomyces platensis]WJY41526.1 alpha/beta fold hydrolase [Streptomyces sp. P9-2B-2]
MGGSLVCLRASGGRRALVFIHPASGSAASFRALLPHLRSDCSVYAFHSPGIDPDRPRSIEGIAKAYLAEFLSADSRSTPVFVGWSFSGPVAVEMARLAEEAGVSPAGVILLDSATHEVLGERTTDLATEVGGLFGIDMSRAHAPTVDELLDHAAALIAVASDTPGLTGQDLRPFWDVYSWHQGIFDEGWRASPCRAPLLVIRARDETGWNSTSECLGWSEVVNRPVSVAWAGGTHYTMMDDSRLADIALIIEQAGDQWGAGPGPLDVSPDVPRNAPHDGASPVGKV